MPFIKMAQNYNPAELGQGGVAAIGEAKDVPVGVHAPAPPSQGKAGSSQAASAAQSKRKQALAESLVKAKGSADASDKKLVVAELMKMPESHLQQLKKQGSEVVVGRGSVTDVRTDLKGVKPRGWPPGKTWDDVPGLQQGGDVVVATIGHNTPKGARVPRTGEKHGSQNVVLHEVGHALDRGKSNSTAFKKARTKDLSALSAYEKQKGKAGLEETFAESYATYYEGNSKAISKTPNLAGYWKKDPIPKPKAPKPPPKSNR